MRKATKSSNRPDIRELLGAATNAGNLGDDPERTTASDRVFALAKASELGSLLVHLKYGAQLRYFNQALDLWMARRLEFRQRRRPGIRWGAIDRVLHQMALEEWLIGVCLTCRGTGKVGSIFGQLAPVRVACGTCSPDPEKNPGQVVLKEPGKKPRWVTCPTCHGMPIFRNEVSHEVCDCAACHGTGAYVLQMPVRLARLQEAEDAATMPVKRVYDASDWENRLRPVYQDMLDELREFDKGTAAVAHDALRRFETLDEMIDRQMLAEMLSRQYLAMKPAHFRADAY